MKWILLIFMMSIDGGSPYNNLQIQNTWELNYTFNNVKECVYFANINEKELVKIAEYSYLEEKLKVGIIVCRKVLSI